MLKYSLLHQAIINSLTHGKFWSKRWHLVSGCSKVSVGCENCWMEKEARLREHHPVESIRRLHEGLLTGAAKWNGKVRFNYHLLLVPLFIKKPEVFAIWTDLFHESVSFESIDRAMAVMLACNQLGLGHLFIAPTKRAARQQEYFNSRRPEEHLKVWWQLAKETAPKLFAEGKLDLHADLVTEELFPLPNMVGCVTAETGKMVNERIPAFLGTPFRRRVLLAEPLLGPIDVTSYLGCSGMPGCVVCEHGGETLHNVISGGESGSSARPAHPEWFRSLRDQCSAADVPFLFKGWGEWLPQGQKSLQPFTLPTLLPDKIRYDWPDGNRSVKLGKKVAGNMLDGQELLQVANG